MRIVREFRKTAGEAVKGDTMDNAAVAKKLQALAQLDYDAKLAYDEAIEKIDAEHADVRNSLSLFRNDHQRHFNDLSRVISSIGGEVPSMSPDIKGRMIKGMTSLRSSTGTAGALKAMQTNENLTNTNYADATSDPDFGLYPNDLQQLLLNNYADEKRHLSYIESTLSAMAMAAPR